jgi:hypothetical protein
MNLFNKKCFCEHKELPGFHDENICVDLSDGIRILTKAVYGEDYKVLLCDPKVWDDFSFWHQKIWKVRDERTVQQQLDHLESWLEGRVA